MSDCRIFDLVSIDEDSYRCQRCGKIHSQKDFNEILKSAPVRVCSCGGKEKKMDVYVPFPVSGYETRSVFYVCNSCGGKYMYYRDTCESCGKTCDRKELYCYECEAKIKGGKEDE